MMCFKFGFRVTIITFFVILLINELSVAQFYVHSGSDPLHVNINTGNDTSICKGSSINLVAVAGGGDSTSAYKYTWSPSAGLSSTSIFDPIAIPTVTTTYTVTVKDQIFSTASASVKITVNPKPAISITPHDSTSTCKGISVNLTALGGLSYVWSNGSQSSSPTVNPTSTTVYTVTGTDKNGCTNSSSVTVLVVPYPVANFTFSPDFKCANLPISFTNASTGTNLIYYWNFGDPGSGSNDTSYLANPTHTFSSAIGNGGTKNFIVTLNVTSSEFGSNCISTDKKTITVKQLPDPSLTCNTNFNNCNNASVNDSIYWCSLKNNSSTINGDTSYLINWGDGTPDNNKFTNDTVGHGYKNYGIYYITFTVWDSNGCFNSQQYMVKNIKNPGLSFGNPGKTSGCAPKKICFSISNFSTNDSSTTYTFNFGDSTPKIVYTQFQLDSICHLFPPDSCFICHWYTKPSCGQNPGTIDSNTFVASAIASNPCTPTPATTGGIHIYSPPIAAFNAPSFGCVNTPITFTDTTVLGFDANCSHFTNFIWKFIGGGNGGTDTTIVIGTDTTNIPVIITYKDTGSYLIILKAFNQTCLDSNSAQQTICINSLPVALFSINDSVFCRPDSVFFTNLCKGSNQCGNATYTWSVTCFNDSCNNLGCGGYRFLDNTNIHSINPVIFFSQPGKYKVELTYANGCTPSIYNKTIRVESKPTVSINLNSISICQGDSITPTLGFTQCYSNISSYLWSFPGGNPSSSFAIIPGTIVYNSLGIHNISITSANGCGDTTFTEQIFVDTLPLLAQKNNIFVCPDSNINIGNFTSKPSGAIFSWTNSNNLIGLASSGNGNIPSWNAAPNNTGSNIEGTITVTPTLNGCPGSSMNFNITIYPSPNVTVNSPVICLGQSATLIASGANSYIWSNSATTNSIIVNPTTDTSYTVTGTNTSTGCSKSVTSLVIVHTVPVVSYSHDSVACLNDTVHFNDFTTGGQTYLWKFGDGITSNLFDTIHTYTNPGKYIIYLIAASTCGKDSLSSSINVVQAATPKFTLSPDSGCAPLHILITNQSLGTDIHYFWNFGILPTSNGTGPFNKTYPGSLNDTTYIIVLKDSNICGSFSHFDSIKVFSKPGIGFANSKFCGCSGTNIEFYIYQINHTDSLKLIYGDGTSSIHIITPDYLQNDTLFHTFTYNGYTDTVYTITLIGFNACGTDSIKQPFTIYPKSVKAFFNIDSATPWPGCVPLTVHFDNYSTGEPSYICNSSDSVSYLWKFGDGDISSSKNPTYTYNDTGTFIVRLIVKNGCSKDSFSSGPISVFPLPDANFKILNNNACQGKAISFSTPPDPGNMIISYVWNFGDSSAIDSTNTNPNHAYLKAGTYLVTLNVENKYYCHSDTTQSVFIQFSPTASFTEDFDKGCSPLTVNFTNTTDSLNQNRYFWNFGDGSLVSTLLNPSHTFSNNSQCYDASDSVSLVALNDYGNCPNTFRSQIIVLPTPLSNFTASDSIYCCFNTPETIQFNENVQCATGFKWFVNDSLLPSDTNYTSLSYSFSKSNDYEIKLVSFLNSCSDTIIKNFIVYSNWKKKISIIPTKGCEPLGVEFLSSTDSLSYYWDFGDEHDTSSQNVYHQYTQPGIYTVKIDVKGIGGCIDSLTFIDTIDVYQKAEASFAYQISQVLSLNDGTVIFLNNSNYATSYFWNFGDGTTYVGFDTTHRYLFNNNFEVILIANNINDCPDTFAELINFDYLHGLYIPNAFSPTSNNPLVQKFQPIGIGLETYDIQVYDTWGNLIWESTALDDEGRPTEYWDGKLKNGKQLPMDVYVWKATAVFIDGEVWQGMKYRKGEPRPYGNVTIIR